jgi:hypothetical protein
MTQLVQFLLERLTQLPEPVQNRLAQHFLKELEEVETQMAQQPRKLIWATTSLSVLSTAGKSRSRPNSAS